MPNPLQSINQYNNNIAWQYPTKDQILIGNTASMIIPAPSIYNLIDYLTLSNSCSTLDDPNILVYQTNIDIGSYTVAGVVSTTAYNAGSTIAGGTLQQATGAGRGPFETMQSNNPSRANLGQTGTWRAMGYSQGQTSKGTTNGPTNLWVRIS